MKDREYTTTHPWLTFDVSRQLERAPRRLWELVGGVSSLIEVLADTPLLPEVAQEMHQVYLAKGALATTAIEGNTLTEDEARLAVERDLALPPSKEYLGTEITNMVDAFNDVLADVHNGTAKPLAPATIMEMNRKVLKGLELDPGVIPGEISEHGVVVGMYRGAPRRDCEYLLERLCGWLDSPRGEKAVTMDEAILHALLAHLYLAWIHPFGDGNGRTARLVEFTILCRGGVPAPASHLLSNHFNDTRTAYYRQLSHASQSGGEVTPFLVYALQGLLDGLRTQLDRIRNQTEQLVWQRLVHNALPGHSAAIARRRHLAIALFDEVTAVPRNRLTQLTAELVHEHAGTSSKTLTRDIHELEAVRLIYKTIGGYKVNRSLILGLTPSGGRSD